MNVIESFDSIRYKISHFIDPFTVGKYSQTLRRVIM